MTRDLADQLDRALGALQTVLETPREKISEYGRARQEAYRQIACLRDQLSIEPCKGDSWRDIFRRK